MSKLPRSNLPAEPSNLLEKLSLMVYETLVSLQQHEPEWIVERHRCTNLSDFKIAFVSQLQDNLEQIYWRAPIALMLKRFLQQICTPSFFASDRFAELLQQIDREFFSRQDDRPLQIESIAILLLDVENLHLTALEETMLSRFSTYPIKVRIAFANWRALGKHDMDYHDRGYQMIHVPQGKNAADIQMTAIGSSLFFQYPQAKEVFVCSNDAHLVMLCNLLQTQGWKVHAVRKWGEKFALADWTTGKIQIFALTTDHFDPHDDLEQKLAKLLLAVTTMKSSETISIGALASQFKKQYGFGVTEVMKAWKMGSSFLAFLRSCEMFRLVFINEQWHVKLHPIVPSLESMVEESIFDRMTPA